MLLEEVRKVSTRLSEHMLNDEIGKLERKLRFLKLQRDREYKFSKVTPFFRFNPSSVGLRSDTVGVYVIWHSKQLWNEEETVTDLLPMYVGEGVISQRVRRHLSVYENLGVPIDHGSSMSTSPVASKMWDYDRFERNWWVTVCRTDDKTSSKLLEEQMFWKLKPEFNNWSSLANNQNL